jgi:MFS family permease
MTAAVAGQLEPTRALSRRLRPLQIGAGLQGFMLWVPVEKLFQTQIGFNAASIGLMAAAYAAVVPLLEVPSGILADRWSRTGILIISSIAAAASALVGGLSHNVVTYIVAAMILGVYFAMNSGTVDSVVYDTVIEETGSSQLYEKWIGRVRIVEGAAFATSALAGGLLAGWTSPRLTYFLTIPFVLASVAAFVRFREPRLHRAAEPVAIRRHIAVTFGAMTQIPQVRRMLLLAALTALLSSAVFEFGPLWLVDLHAPAAAYGPYWALLVATLGIGGYLVAKVHLDHGVVVVVIAGLLTASAALLAITHTLLLVAVAQTVLALLLAIIGIHAGRLLHDTVPSNIRAGVSSGAGTFSWMLFLPFSLVFGALARSHGVYWAGWVLVGVVAALAVLLLFSTRAAPAHVDAEPGDAPRQLAKRPATDIAPTDVACRELVGLLSDYLDDVLDPGWRAQVDEHVRHCDGCSNYLYQIRATVELLAQLNDTIRQQADDAAT